MRKSLHLFLSLASLMVPTLAFGAASVPLYIAPTEEDFNKCVVEDVDDDGTKCTFFTEDGEGCFRHGYTYDGDTDDYLYMEGVELQPGTYKITYQYKTKTDLERFCVGYTDGTVAATSNFTIIHNYKDVREQSWVDETYTFDIATAGVYHLAIHFYSETGKYYTYLRKFNLTKVDENAPKTPVLTVTPDGLDAHVALTLPTTRINGEALTGELTAKISVDGVQKATLTGAPGEELSTVITCESGTHKFMAVVSFEDNGEVRSSEIASADASLYRKCPDPIVLPFEITPDYDEYTWCTVINNNKDSNTWEYTETGTPEPAGPAMRYSSGWFDAADDYFVLPAINLEPGAYEISFDMGTKYNEEIVEVCAASEATVEALSQNKLASIAKSLGDAWETQKVRYVVTEAGPKYIAIRAASPANTAYTYLRNIKVDHLDATLPANPALEAVFDGGDGNLKVTFPSIDIVGNPLTSDKLYAVVTLDGTEAETPVEGTPGQVVEIPYTGLAKGPHTASVYVYFEQEGVQKSSDPVKINFSVGLPSSFHYDIPMALTLGQDMFNDMILLDANGDGKTWAAEAENIKYTYSSSNPADDWLFTAPVQIDDISKIIRVAVDAKTGSYKEAFEIWLGTAQNPESMTKLLISRSDYKQQEYLNEQQLFQLEEAGSYIIGIHACSEANMYYLYLKNLTMEYFEGVAPAKPIDAVFAADPTGALKATATFIMPAKDALDGDLDPETELTATLTCGEASAQVTGKPGTEHSITVDCVEGLNTLSLTIANEFGSSEAVIAEVRCGIDFPKNPVITKATVSDDNMGIHIEWEPVTEGLNGGVVVPENIDYYIFEWDDYDEDWYQVDVFGADQLSYDYRLSASYQGELQNIRLGVACASAVNHFSDYIPVDAILGQPKSLDLEDDFAGGHATHGPISFLSSLPADYMPEWSLEDPTAHVSTATSESGTALVGRTAFNRGDSYVMLPKFATTGYSAVQTWVTLYVYPSMPEYKMVYRDAEGTFHDLQSLDPTGIESGWYKFVVDLPAELLDKAWAEVGLFVNFTGGSSNRALIDSYAIGDPASLGVDNVTDGIAAGFEVLAADGGVIVKGAAGKTVGAYTVDGRAVSTAAITSDSQFMPLAPGAYVISTGNAGKAVLVK